MRAQEACDAIMREIIKEGYPVQIHKKKLQQAIMHALNIIDERAIQRHINALEVFDYISIQSPYPNVYHINPLKIEHLLTILKEKPQVKLQ